MIRPFTILCFLAFASAGAWLYQVKHQVAMKDRDLAAIRRETEGMRQRLDILRAEWALLNEPERLRQAAMRVVALEPMLPTHFARFNELDRRLPAVVTFAGAPNLFAPPPGSLREAAPAMLAAVPGRPGATPAPAPAGAAPVATARTVEAPEPQALAAAIAQQRAEAARRAEALARAEAANRARSDLAGRIATPAAAPRPITPAVHVAPPPVTEPRTRLTQAAPPVGSGSVLGTASALGRPMLAPPVPISPAAAATLR